MRIRILASALRDLNEGYLFYEAQDTGLGNYFLSSVMGDVESLHIFAGTHRIVYGDYHRALCRTFPFAIYYLKDGDVATIYAVVDCRRDPAWIRRHLDEGGQQGT